MRASTVHSALLLAMLLTAWPASRSAAGETSVEPGVTLAAALTEAELITAENQERLRRVKRLRAFAFEARDEKRVLQLDQLESRIKTLQIAELRRLRRMLPAEERAAFDAGLGRGTKRAVRSAPAPASATTSKPTIATRSDHGGRRPKITRRPAPGTAAALRVTADRSADRRQKTTPRRPPGALRAATPEGRTPAPRTRRAAPALDHRNAEAEFLRLIDELRR